MTAVADSSPSVPEALARLRRNVRSVYRGPDHGLDLALTCLVAGGHLLLDDVPGVGKTTLARALAQSVGLECQRLQFTSDLLPGDVTGSSVYDPRNGTFTFRRGPVFCNILLGDEINRASPRTQSALLECMEEGAVTVDGQRHPLPALFWVVATQNPVETQGTFLLPRSQLDRFLIRTSLGYPDASQERAIVDADRRGEVRALEAVISAEDLTSIQRTARTLHADQRVLDYAVTLVRASRERPDFSLGASPRATVALMRAACAWALLAGRDHVWIDDVKSVAGPVLSHRLVEADGESSPVRPALIQALLDAVPSPL